MVKLVLVHKAASIYDDEPDVQYDFPKAYLGAVSAAVGDWVVYYEPVKAGDKGYFAVAKIAEVIPKPGAEGRYLALIAPGSFLQFDRDVPRLEGGRPLEAALAGADGLPAKGGAVQLAERRLPEREFERIVGLGLPADLEEVEATRYDLKKEMDAQVEPFVRPVLERLTRRPFRDVAFRRRVREAYDYRCAVSGLRLRNGGRAARSAGGAYPARGAGWERCRAQRACAVGDAALDVRPGAHFGGGGPCHPRVAE